MRRISDPRPIDISGYLLPYSHDRFVMVCIEGKHFLPVFSDQHKLDAAMVEAGVEQYSIKQIDDADSFLQSVNDSGFQVALNPHRKDGKVNFHLCVPSITAQ